MGSLMGRSTGSARRPCFASTRTSRPAPWRGSARRGGVPATPQAAARRPPASPGPRGVGRAAGPARARPGAPPARLAGLAGPTRLGALGVPEADLPGLAADAAARGGNLANPKPASPDEIEQLLRDVY